MNIGKIKETYEDVVWAGKKRVLGLPLSFTTYILTKTKLITRVGLLNLKEDELELYRIIDKRTEFPLSQRMFRCGTIILTAADSDTPSKTIKSIKDARKVKAGIDKLVDAQRMQYNVRGRDMFGAAASNLAEDSVPDIQSLF